MSVLLSLLRRPCPDDPVYRERLERELALVAKNKFEETFLQVVEILALTRDIPHIVRGSAGSSLLCYLLGITNFDPIVLKIPLARFMHDFRTDTPDIDIDFPHNLRDEVVRRLSERFPGRVARISNHLKYRYASAIREVMRRHGHRRFVPRHFDLVSMFGEELASQMEREADALVGKDKGISLHCGGVIVFPGAVPRGLEVKPGQIRLDKDEVEAAGLIKIDLLCNRGMTVLHECDPRPAEDYPDYDAEVAELLSSGDTLGITYGESPTMRKALRAIRPRCRADVALALAMIRPAAASRGPKKSAFLDNWRVRREQTELVYDDDAILLLQRLLGCSEGEADQYRRGLAKGRPDVAADLAARLAHLPDRDAVLEDMGRMRHYSFCRSHATSYSYLVWALAYQKIHNPYPFWRAVLNHAQSVYRPWVHVQEAKRAGLRVEPGRAPWSLAGDTLLNPGRQRWLFEEDGFGQYRARGFWSSPRFFPGTFARYRGDQVEFRGLIATHKHWSSADQDLTFATVGVPGDYLDLSLDGHLPLDLHDLVKGYGQVLDLHGSRTVQVTDYWLERA